MSDTSQCETSSGEHAEYVSNISSEKESKLKECVANVISDTHQEKRRNTLETTTVADPFVPKINANIDFDNI